MGKVAKPRFYSVPKLTVIADRHEALLIEMRADLDLVANTVCTHLRQQESGKSGLPLGGGEDYTSAECRPRFEIGGLVRFRGQMRGVDDKTVIARFQFNGDWSYWIAGATEFPCTYRESQLESAE